MKTYELTYIISPESTLEEAEICAKKIESFIQSKEGVLLKQSTPIAKTLSYPIEKHASGFVASIEFQLEAENLKEVKNKITEPNESNAKIVRHIIIIKKPLKDLRRKRQKKEAVTTFETIKTENTEIIKPASEKSSAGLEKVELKDIEQKLEELLGE
jgi:ribosomal protein S6